MATKTSPVSKLSKTYLVKFVGGPLDGREQYCPLPSRAPKKNPRFIDKSYWEGGHTRRHGALVKTTSRWWNRIEATLKKIHGYYVCSTEDTRKVKQGDVVIYSYNPAYNPDKDEYFETHPNEKPVI